MDDDYDDATYLTVCSHRDNVEGNDNKQKDQANCPAREVVRPVLQQ